MGAYVSTAAPKTKWSVLHAEVIKLGAEFEVEYDDEENGLEHFKRCQKNAGHKNMIPMTEFTIDKLPAPWRLPKLHRWIMDECNSTVKVKVSYISLNRPDKYCLSKQRGKRINTTGTGRIRLNEDVLKKEPIDCPLEKCSFSESPHKVTPIFEVTTATHVVFDQEEAENCEIEFFYDSADRRNVVIGQAVGMDSSSRKTDSCSILCVSHDLSLFYKVLAPNPQLPPSPSISLPEIRNEKTASLVVIVAHPHGCFKHVSVGEWTGHVPEPSKVAHGYKVPLCVILNSLMNEFPDWERTGITFPDGSYLSPEHVKSHIQQAEKYPGMSMEQIEEQVAFQLLDNPGASYRNLDVYSLIYTAATCPGSSGASVWIYTQNKDGTLETSGGASHFKHKKGKGNASGRGAVRVPTSFKIP